MDEDLIETLDMLEDPDAKERLEKLRQCVDTRTLFRYPEGDFLITRIELSQPVQENQFVHIYGKYCKRERVVMVTNLDPYLRG